MYATQAMRLILGNLADAYRDGSNSRARSHMARGSLMAGYTLANAGTTMVHALAHVLGARARVPHGLANAIFLLPIMQFYAERVPEKIDGLAGAVGVPDSVIDKQARADQAVAIMEKMVDDVEIDRKLGNHGVNESDIRGFAEATVATRRLMLQSPVDATVEDVEAVLQGIY
jgi:alcohol dehydrogenase class IV